MVARSGGRLQRGDDSPDLGFVGRKVWASEAGSAVMASGRGDVSQQQPLTDRRHPRELRLER
jgi:hypothetical protein